MADAPLEAEIPAVAVGDEEPDAARDEKPADGTPVQDGVVDRLFAPGSERE